ncbi:MAG: aminotransferase class I/II-fold pyridoxal phosphate-dependent enzyme [Candidatus Omnitrophica bacterium]|nr:aminotransferase class I/II-fold pyridoxal phosphate-dependent enzyme [Candidatus Omnitrophota bacterium]HOX53831.1 aminotransferase class I/II-fold pyridoxal phosphate-dependent enzyme [Candidatus Omnitrophota bacterium]
MDTLQQTIENTVKNLLVKIGEEKDAGKIKNDFSIKDDLGIDSLDGIQLISALEDTFQIDIPDRNFDSSLKVGDIINLVQSRLNASAEKIQGKIDKASLINSLRVDKSLLSEAQFNPYYRNIQSGLGGKIRIDNKEFICLGSNDYLGIANNPKIKNVAIKAIRKYGLSMCGTPIVIGQSDANRALELKIAEFLKQDDALVFPSGFQSNIGIFQLLANKDDVILADKNIHSSLINGCLLAKADLKLFRHNDTKDLETLLNNSVKYRMRFIVVEGLYSTDGDIAPLDRISALAKEFDSFLIVDDAHGIGVLGREGRGILEKFNAYKDIDLISGSLGKAIGLSGGFLAGKESIIDHFKYNCPMYFYSTALPAHIAAAGISAIDFIQAHNDIRIKIFKYKEKLFGALKDMGYRLSESKTPLFSILFRNSQETVKFSKLLFEKLVYTVAFIPPSVPEDSPRIRILASAYLKDKDIDKAIAVFKALKKEYVG